MPPNRYKRVYLDSSVYLAAIKGEDGRVEQSRLVLNAAESGLIEIIVSTFTFTEVFKIKGEDAISEEIEKKIDAILMSDKLLVVELDLSLALEARKLARLHGLKPGDSIHLATAIRHKAELLFRYDDRFKSKTEIAGLELCEPFWYGDAPMPGLEKGKT